MTEVSSMMPQVAILPREHPETQTRHLHPLIKWSSCLPPTKDEGVKKSFYQTLHDTIR